MKFFTVNKSKIYYTDTSRIDDNYTERMNEEYNWMAKIYDLFIFLFPLWKKWIKKVIPHIQGKRVLEVSFGSGYLMSKYGSKNNYDIFGIDYNEKMIDVTNKNLNLRK